MNPKEAYKILAGRLDISPELVPFLAEVGLDQTIINPILPETVRELGRILDLRPGRSILDLACGKGGVSLPLVDTYKVNLTGVDLMPDFIREAWSRAEYTGLYNLCNFKMADAAGFAAGTKDQWDAVLILGALIIIWQDMDQGLDAVTPLVRPGGHLVIGHPYRLPGGAVDPEEPFPAKDETTSRLARTGRVVEILDDGVPGWESYADFQLEGMLRIKHKHPNNPELTAFLDAWARQLEWEMKNLGFAVWVVKID
ncbi:MAG: class I SAM-dependent methyltransferase [Thermodesulfobacteriota bacterium]|nr:class I SAM-dependent methyltransferase [Thermodesulfobacteriota bacterium]